MILRAAEERAVITVINSIRRKFKRRGLTVLEQVISGEMQRRDMTAI